MTATSGNFKGAINSGSTITGSNISGGTVHGSAITGSTIDISANGGYLQMGAGDKWTKHPSVSGLNVTGGGGIVCEGSIEFTGDLRIIKSNGQLQYTGKPAKGGEYLTKQFSWTDREGKMISLYFCRGILVDFEEK